MKYLDEYRSSATIHSALEKIRQEITRPWTIMEICGGQTHSIIRHGLDHLLPEEIELLHGPGCPVCVTPIEMIDRAHAVASRAEVIFCSYGDMLRVPGSDGDLLRLKSLGKDIRVVYSPLDAVKIAAANPGREVVFFAIGFETTAPASATAIASARARGIRNFSALVSHVLVPPAMAAILSDPHNRVQAFLGPGHVCAVMGCEEYAAVALRYRCPVVITGFEPLDLLCGMLHAIRQLEAGEARAENAYTRAVREEGNSTSRRLLEEVFEVVDQKWRGVGAIPASGFGLRTEFADFDASKKFAVAAVRTQESPVCIAGKILRGLKKPHECPAFGTACTPQHPLGATMVSGEGACAAYHAYGRIPIGVHV